MYTVGLPCVSSIVKLCFKITGTYIVGLRIEYVSLFMYVQ